VSLVVDASITIAWLFTEERTDLPQAVLRRVAAEGALVPSIWRLEVPTCFGTPLGAVVAMRDMRNGRSGALAACGSPLIARPTDTRGAPHGSFPASMV